MADRHSTWGRIKEVLHIFIFGNPSEKGISTGSDLHSSLFAIFNATLKYELETSTKPFLSVFLNRGFVAGGVRNAATFLASGGHHRV